VSYHTYFVVTDGQGRLDTFYICEDQYEHMTQEEFQVLFALMPNPPLINLKDIAYFNMLNLRARYAMGKFLILKSEHTLDRKDIQAWLDNRKFMRNRALAEL
jgi:hypothetical protein